MRRRRQALALGAGLGAALGVGLGAAVAPPGRAAEPAVRSRERGT